MEIDGFRNVPGMYYTSFGGGLGGRLYRCSTVAEVVVFVKVQYHTGTVVQFRDLK